MPSTPSVVQRRGAERPDPGCEGADQAEDQQGGATSRAGRAVGAPAVAGPLARITSGSSAAPAATGRSCAGMPGSVHDDRGQDRGDDQRPAAEVGPPVAERARLQRAVPAEAEQVRARRAAASPRSGVRRQRDEPPQEQRQARQQRDRDRRADRRVRRASQPLPTQSTRPPITATTSAPYSRRTGWLRDQAPTPTPSASRAPPTSALVPRQSQGVQPGQAGRLGGQEVDREHAGHHQPEGLGRSAQALAGEQHGDAGEQCR